jgi:hypothetical protein
MTTRSTEELIEDLAIMVKKGFDEMATKADLEYFAKKTDLEYFATKKDLERFATKADLERFATKADLSYTKDYLSEKIDHIDFKITGLVNRVEVLETKVSKSV